MLPGALFSVLCGMMSLLVSTSLGDVMISEVNMRTQGTSPTGRFVELYNSGDTAVDLTNHYLAIGTFDRTGKLIYRTNRYLHLAGYTIRSKRYLVIGAPDFNLFTPDITFAIEYAGRFTVALHRDSSGTFDGKNFEGQNADELLDIAVIAITTSARDDHQTDYDNSQFKTKFSVNRDVVMEPYAGGVEAGVNVIEFGDVSVVRCSTDLTDAAAFQHGRITPGMNNGCGTAEIEMVQVVPCTATCEEEGVVVRAPVCYFGDCSSASTDADITSCPAKDCQGVTLFVGGTYDLYIDGELQSRRGTYGASYIEAPVDASMLALRVWNFLGQGYMALAASMGGRVVRRRQWICSKSITEAQRSRWMLLQPGQDVLAWNQPQVLGKNDGTFRFSVYEIPTHAQLVWPNMPKRRDTVNDVYCRFTTAE